ncbi:MAG: ABC transporter ATP-binding protein [Thermotogaceae bacterium]|nr:ABC transporter ATP-binding protein [Thermotogaceae bacterium]
MILEVKSLYKSYGEKVAVDGVSFEIGRGEIFTIVGRNGAGKTTTIKCILGLRKKDSGEILMKGSRTYLPEDKKLYRNYTVEKMLYVAEGISRYFHRERARELAKKFKLPENEKIANLSHGMLTLLYLSIVFAEDVDLYILDEPTWGLDPVVRSEVLDMIRDMAAGGKSFLITTHILQEAEKISDRVAIMKDGKFLEIDSVDSLKEKYVAVRVGLNEYLEEGYLYKVASNEKIYIVERGKVSLEYQPASFEMIFQALVRGERK